MSEDGTANKTQTGASGSVIDTNRDDSIFAVTESSDGQPEQPSGLGAEKSPGSILGAGNESSIMQHGHSETGVPVIYVETNDAIFTMGASQKESEATSQQDLLLDEDAESLSASIAAETVLRFQDMIANDDALELGDSIEGLIKGMGLDKKPELIAAENHGHKDSASESLDYASVPDSGYEFFIPPIDE